MGRRTSPDTGRGRREEGGTGLDGVGQGFVLAGRYRLEERLQADSRGSQWRAVDQTLERQVVVRILDAAHPQTEDIVDAARRAALAEDPRLVRILDVGSQPVPGGHATYVISEHVNGRTVASAVSAGPLPAELARRIVGEASQALARAASRGLHHLRLEPSAVWITHDGAVKVSGTAIDASVAGAEYETSDAAERADAVGLVSVLYAALTGRWPGPDKTGLGAAPRVGGRPVPPGDLSAGVPNDLDTLCAVTLGPNDDGPRTPAELADELSPWARSAQLTDPRGLALNSPNRPAPRPAPKPVQHPPVRPVARPAAPSSAPSAAPAARGSAPPPPAAAPASAPPAPAPAPPARPARPAAATAGAAAPAAAPSAPATAAPGPTPEPSWIAQPAAPKTGRGKKPRVTRGTQHAPQHARGGRGGQPGDEFANGPGASVLTPPAVPTAAPAPDAPAAAAPSTPAAPATRTPAPGTPAPAEILLPQDAPDRSGPVGAQRPAQGSTSAPERQTAPSASAQAPAPAAPPTSRPDSRPLGGAADLFTPSPTNGAGYSYPGARDDPYETMPFGAVGTVRGPWAGLGKADDHEEYLGPFLPPAPLTRPTKDQSRLVLAIVAGAVVVLLIVALWSLRDFGSPGDTTVTPLPSVSTSAPTTPAPSPSVSASTPAATPSTSTAVPVVDGLRALDPLGDNEENDQLVSNAADGNPQTEWRTARYNTQAFGGLKTGLGLAIKLGERAPVAEVDIDTRGNDGVVELRVADGPDFEGSSVIATGTVTDGRLVLKPERPIATEWLIVWVTRLPDVNGSGQFYVSEIKLR
jgi:hypothetical protein